MAAQKHRRPLQVPKFPRKREKGVADYDQTTQPRPDWMSDPSLLPKRPPGKA